MGLGGVWTQRTQSTRASLAHGLPVPLPESSWSSSRALAPGVRRRPPGPPAHPHGVTRWIHWYRPCVGAR